MNFNRRQIGILLFTLFSLIAGLTFYSHSLITDGLNPTGELSSKSRHFITDWLNYLNLFLILQFIVGAFSTILLISQKNNIKDQSKSDLSDEDIYHSEDLIQEKKEVVKVDNVNELKYFSKEIESLCKKNLPHYDFCKGILSIVGAHLPLVQGAFYNSTIINNEDFIELTAGYAFNKPEHGKIKLLLGEGLAGQAAKSKELSKITDLPPSYLEITSGLGSSNKVSLYEFPLIRKKDMVGVIELAFFKELTNDHIKEIQKSTSSIARRVLELKKEMKN